MRDPRVLDCFHSFCFQCLLELDGSIHTTQAADFWRKISENSDSEWNCKHFRVDDQILKVIFFFLVSVYGRTDPEPSSVVSRSSIDSAVSPSTKNLSIFSERLSSFSSVKSRRIFRNKVNELIRRKNSAIK